MSKLTLITGGARSGKTRFAQAYAESLGSSRAYLATAGNLDNEMAARITRHKEERAGRGWYTIEETIDLASVFRRPEQWEVILVDCLTLWVSNLMFEAEDQGEILEERHMPRKLAPVLEAMKGYPGQIVLVTNEVGLGIVPDNEYARRYRDLLGRTNQQIAQAATNVILMTCGVPLAVKGESANAFLARWNNGGLA